MFHRNCRARAATMSGGNSLPRAAVARSCGLLLPRFRRGKGLRLRDLRRGHQMRRVVAASKPSVNQSQPPCRLGIALRCPLAFLVGASKHALGRSIPLIGGLALPGDPPRYRFSQRPCRRYTWRRGPSVRRRGPDRRPCEATSPPRHHPAARRDRSSTSWQDSAQPRRRPGQRPCHTISPPRHSPTGRPSHRRT
jgi:hypothetical protein